MKLINEFHGTSYNTVRGSSELRNLIYREQGGTGFLGEQLEAREAIRRIRTKLCGIPGCRCSLDDYGQHRTDLENLIA